MKGAFYAVVAILILVIVGSVLFLLFAPAPDKEPPTTEIRYDEPFNLRVGEEVQISETSSLILEDIIQDSRCPVDSSVNCVWEGTVVSLLSVVHKEASDATSVEEIHESIELEITKEKSLGKGLSATLVNVSPEQSATEIDPALYELTFIITMNEEPEEVVEKETDLILYFSSEMEKRGTEVLGGFPIEGYSPFAYLNAFSGLLKTDFIGTEALQGTYSISEGELLFTLGETDAIHSAAETLSKDGMETLLKNLSLRLNLPTNTTESIDQLIEKIK